MSNFRWLPRSATVPMPNCLDSAKPPPSKSGSLARTSGDGGLSRNSPLPQVVVKALSPRPNHD